MTVITVAHGWAPEVLTAVLAGHLSPSVNVVTRRFEWGAMAIADAPFWEGRGWMIAGMPQSDPWGLPGQDLPGDEVLAELDRWGPVAIQMSSGPVVAVDLSTGTVVRALNGIIPVTVSPVPGGTWVASTSRAVVLELSGCEGTDVAPGHAASPGEFVSLCGDIIAEDLQSVTWAGVDEELDGVLGAVRGRRRSLARGPALREDPEERYVHCCSVPGRAVFTPPLGSAEDRTMARYLRLRNEVSPRLWFRARLVGLWLCAPAFERPALDLVALAATAPGVEARS